MPDDGVYRVHKHIPRLRRDFEHIARCDQSDRIKHLLGDHWVGIAGLFGGGLGSPVGGPGGGFSGGGSS